MVAWQSFQRSSPIEYILLACKPINISIQNYRLIAYKSFRMFDIVAKADIILDASVTPVSNFSVIGFDIGVKES
jgi:hypothetical protein